MLPFMQKYRQIIVFPSIVLLQTQKQKVPALDVMASGCFFCWPPVLYAMACGDKEMRPSREATFVGDVFCDLSAALAQ